MFTRILLALWQWCLIRVGREDELWAALRLRPDDAEAHYQLSVAMLAQGKFEEGWLEHEWRLRWRKPNQRKIGSPRWSGQELAGKRLLLRSEHDPRDTIQLARYADLLARQGAHVILECEDALVDVMSGSLGVREVIGFSQPLPGHDFHANLLSLPAICSTTSSTVPADRPYLGVRTEAIQQWKRIIAADGRQTIGIALEPDGAEDRSAQLSLKWSEIIQRLAGNVDLVFVDLQNAIVFDGYNNLRVRRLPGVRSVPAERFSDWAGAIRNLDVVIATDNRLAHIAAAMGVPTWVVLPLVPHHRWGIIRSDSSWYPSVRLFRQKIRSDWNELLHRVIAAVDERSRVAKQG